MKILILTILTLTALWNLMLKLVNLRSAKNPVPENVQDIYDGDSYRKWQDYTREKTRLGIIRGLVSFVLSFLLIAFDVYALFDGERVYPAAILVTVFDTVLSQLVGIPADWKDTMGIEEKYGFNKSSRRTFVTDEIKNLIIGLILGVGITCLYALVHQWLGDKMVVLFAVLLALLVLFIGFLSPVFLKIFNKFTPLEEGELRDKLTALLTENGYSVREIKVMDASRRSTKSNAMFTGFGKSKTIILYDTLVNRSDPDEICAVFAHEMGHGLHKDTLKLQTVNFLQILALAFLAWFSVRTPEMYTSFGFEQVNYGFAAILMGIFMSIVAPLFGLFMNAMSRRAEFRADRQAVKAGYGEALISALKKLSRDNFANLAPARLTVLLEYSHPTTSDRISAIEKAIAERESL